MQHREIPVGNSVRRLAFFGSAVSKMQIRDEPTHWEPESGVYDKQKAKHLSNFICQAEGGSVQALFTSCVTLWDFPQY